MRKAKALLPLPHLPWTRSFYRSNREYACVTSAIGRCLYEQKHSLKNVLFHAIGAREFEHMARRALTSRLVDTQGDFIVLQQDTLYVLAQILQDSMIHILSRAHSISCTMCRAREYPILTVEHLRHDTVDSNELVPNDLLALELATVVAEIVPELVCDRIVRRLSRRAGIARMTNETFGLAWATLVNIMLRLLRPAIVKLISLCR